MGLGLGLDTIRVVNHPHNDKGFTADVSARLGLGLLLWIGNQIADLKLSIVAPIQIADLNLTPCL